jgi:hypothetical protein
MTLASVSPTVAGSKPKKLLDQTRDVLRPGKILRVVKRSALRKARSVPSFDARRNSCCATRDRFIQRSTSSFRYTAMAITAGAQSGPNVK